MAYHLATHSDPLLGAAGIWHTSYFSFLLGAAIFLLIQLRASFEASNFIALEEPTVPLDMGTGCEEWSTLQLLNVTSISTIGNQTPTSKRDERDNMCRFTNVRQVEQPYRLYGGPCGRRFTCLTPKSRDLKTAWPWRDQEQHRRFYPRIQYSLDGIPDYSTSGARRRDLLEMANHRARAKRLNYSCLEDGETMLKTSSPQIELSLGTHQDGGDFLFFFPGVNLVFCGIPSAGFTEWLQFLRFTLGAGDFLSHPHFKQDREPFLMQRLPKTKAQEILNDPEWTKAVFFRDPAERLLSAYMEKIIDEQLDRKLYGIDERNDTRLSFSEFVSIVTDPAPGSRDRNKFGLSWQTNPYWRPQTMIGGLDVLLPIFDFVGNFDHAAEQTKRLLREVGLWETHGAKFTAGPPGLKLGIDDVYRVSEGTKPEGFMQRRASKDQSFQSLMQLYYTPKLREKVRASYSMDYEVWDDLSSRDSSDVPSGRDLKTVQDYCQRQNKT